MTIATSSQSSSPGRAIPKEANGRAGLLPVVSLGAVVLIFVALASVIAIKTPAWQAADEPGHVQNIESLVRSHWYSIDSHCPFQKIYFNALFACNGDEAHQAPLYYLLMAGWQDLTGLPAHEPPQSITDYQNARHRGDHGFLMWLRFPNILLGALTVVMTFVVTRLIVRDRWIPVIAAALVASFPHFVFLSAFVTNDNLVNLLGAVLSFCALKCVSRQYSNQWMVATGVVFGLLVTTKLSSIPLGLIIVVLALMASTWRHRISLLLYGTGSALFVSSWYLLQNWVRYGDPLARRASAAYLIRINGVGAPLGLPYVVRDPAHLIFVDVPYRILRTFWYQSGWASFVWSLTTSILITGAICAVLLGLIGQYYPKRELYVLGAISILAFASVWMVAFQTGSYTSRYALVGSAAMAALLALALRPWPLVLRWLLPAAGLLGCLVAIQHDVLSVHLA